MPESPLPALPADPPRTARTHRRRFASGRVILALMLREMSTSYGRTPGGYVWALLEPLGGVLILAIGFSLLVRSPPLGTSFMLFYATGLMPFDLFRKVSMTTAKSLRFSRPLLAYPAVSWIDTILARFFLNTLTGVTVSYILLSGILIFGDSRSVVDIWPVLTAMGLAALLGLGVGSVNAVLMGFYPTWESIWSIITRPLFIISGILILYETLPNTLQDILWWNPLLHIVGEMRTGFYPMYDANYVSHVYVLMLSLALLAFGLMLLRRFHREILDD
jgi:capsular polysaccharide transport system permease protein